MTKEHISWTAVGMEMGRVPQDCYNKWKYVKPTAADGSDVPLTQAESEQESGASSDEGSESDSSADSGSESEAESESLGEDGENRESLSAGNNVLLPKNMRWTQEEVFLAIA